jgi:hypothetical protein
MATYLFYQNGKLFKTTTDTVENAVLFADKYAVQHTGDWVSIMVVDNGRKVEIYNCCNALNVREINMTFVI